MKFELLACVVFCTIAVLCEETSEAPEREQICEPGKAFKKDCNLCRCSKDGKDFACTRKSCPDVHSHQPHDDGRRKREVKQICEPHTSYKKDCNTCRCNDKGTKEICTYIRCPENKRDRRATQCEPHSTFKMDCNTCKCNADGTHAACTYKACPGSRTKKEEIQNEFHSQERL